MLKSTMVIPIISSAYGVGLEKKMFDKVLYEIDSNDMP
jgi:hypothetical protein